MITLSNAATLWWITRVHPDPNHVRYWLILILAVAIGFWALRFMFNSGAEHRNWRNGIWIAAAVVFTGNSLTLVSQRTALMQLSGLLGYTALLTLGLVYNYGVFSIWGAVGITAAVLWYLRDLTYIWIGLLGLALLVAAIWQLRRTTADTKNVKLVSTPAQQQKVPRPPPPGVDPS